MIIRELIKDLAIEDGWTIAGEASNGQEAIDQYHRLRPTAVTLDLVMPERDGLYALRGIRELDPAARVLVISAIDQVDILGEAIRSGASDFITKPFEKQRARRALRLLAKPRETCAAADTHTLATIGATP